MVIMVKYWYVSVSGDASPLSGMFKYTNRAQHCHVNHRISIFAVPKNYNKSKMKKTNLIKNLGMAGMFALSLCVTNLQAQIGATWNPGSPNPGLWSNPANWGGAVPVAGYKAFFNGNLPENSAPCIVDGIAGGCQISIADGSGPDTLIVTNGGDLSSGDAADLNNWGWTGLGTSAKGTMIVENGGNVKFVFHAWIGSLNATSDGTLIMNGGTASVTNGVDANWALGNTGGGVGHIQMNGGTLYLGKYDPGHVNAGSTIDMAGGKIIITGGDRVSNVQADIDAGRIVAYGGSGQVTVDYNVTTPSMTTIMASGGGGGGCATISTFDDFNLDGTYANWPTATIDSTPTNYQVTATGFGGGYKGVVTISTLSTLTLELDVTLTASDVMAPIVILEDGDGTQLQFAWYNTTAGNHVLTMPLSSGVIVQAGSTPGFNYSAISFFHLQVDPEGVGDAYTAAFNNLAITGCGGGTPPQQKITNISVSGGNVSITYETTPGFGYHIEQSPSLSPASWSAVSGSTVNNAAGTEETFTFPIPSEDPYYFKTSSP
jgi:hypothetical protein